MSRQKPKAKILRNWVGNSGKKNILSYEKGKKPSILKGKLKTGKKRLKLGY